MYTYTFVASLGYPSTPEFRPTPQFRRGDHCDLGRPTWHALVLTIQPRREHALRALYHFKRDSKRPTWWPSAQEMVCQHPLFGTGVPITDPSVACSQILLA